MKLFKKPKRYEVMVLQAHEDFVDERLQDAQDHEWEICGDILVKNATGHSSGNYLHIPMKRIKKER